MSRHRLEEPRQVRPRYGRMAAAGLSLVVTMIALLGGIGVLPMQGSDAASGGDTSAAARTAGNGTHGSAARTSTTGASGARSSATPGASSGQGSEADVAQSPDADAATDPAALPGDSGSGKRVVFSKSAQRVWLVDGSGTVTATYLVSGSLTDNLAAGSYEVYSRSRWAVGVQDTGVMQYFVRFAHGQHAAIGFHSIPTKHGTPLQSVSQLGTPQSHGCIRQRLDDARQMWSFADVGTDVVVLA